MDKRLFAEVLSTVRAKGPYVVYGKCPLRMLAAKAKSDRSKVYAYMQPKKHVAGVEYMEDGDYPDIEIAFAYMEPGHYNSDFENWVRMNLAYEGVFYVGPTEDPAASASGNPIGGGYEPGPRYDFQGDSEQSWSGNEPETEDLD